MRVGDLRTNGMGKGVCHRAVQEGADESACTQRIDVACGPHVAHASIRGEDRILGGDLVEHVGGILGVNGFDPVHLARIGANGRLHDLGVLLELSLEECVGATFLNMR